MLDRSKTQIFDQRVVSLFSTVVAADLLGEGQGFVGAFENGVQVARPGRANANDVVLGFSLLQERIFPATRTIVERVTVGSAGAVTLSRAVTTAASTTAKRVDTGETLVENNAAGDGQFNATDGSASLTFHSDEYNKVVDVTYRTAMTVTEALSFNGDSLPGQSATLQIGNITLVTKGYVFTDMFDTVIDWATIDTTVSGEQLKLTTNGYISAGAGVTGAVIPYASVVQIPTVDSPYLGIYINL